jgi:hypothetical protein
MIRIRAAIVPTLVACGGFVAPRDVHAQEPPVISAGSKLVSGSVVEARSDDLRLIVRDTSGAERVQATLIRSVEGTELDGVPTWTVVQVYTTGRGVTVDSSVIRRSDLAPLSYAAHLTNEIQRFRFDGTSVRGTVAPRDSAEREVSYSFDVPPFQRRGG